MTKRARLGGLLSLPAAADGTQRPVISHAALSAGTTRRVATDFLAHLRSDKSKTVFEAQSFTVLSRVDPD
jgi:hypothetical protein